MSKPIVHKVSIIILIIAIAICMMPELCGTAQATGEIDTGKWVVYDGGVLGIDQAAAENAVKSVTGQVSLVLIGASGGTITLPSLSGVVTKLSATGDAAFIYYTSGTYKSHISTMLQNVRFSSSTESVNIAVTDGATQGITITNDDQTFGIVNENGEAHMYKYITGSKSWFAAYSEAVSGQYTLGGFKGYLATVTTENEATLLKGFYDSVSSSSGNGGWIAATSMRYVTGDNPTITSDMCNATNSTNMVTPQNYENILNINVEAINGGRQIKGGQGVYYWTNKTEQTEYDDYYYWACGPEQGQTVSSSLWNVSDTTQSEPNNYGSGESVTVASYNHTWRFNDFPPSQEVPGYFLEFSVYPGGLASNEVTYKSTTIYKVKYDANGATSGTAPGMQAKFKGQALSLATNTGNLEKTGGKGFNGWNTQADGLGTHYDAGAVYPANNNASVTLYAEWVDNPAIAPSVTGPSNISTSYGYAANSHTLAVTATAATGVSYTLSYQWYSNTSASNENGTLIPGATGSTYTIPTGFTPGDYYFYCVVTAERTDNHNKAATASSAAKVTVSKANNPLQYTGTQTVGKTFSSASQTVELTAATNGQGSVSYAINSQPSVNYFTLNGTTLTIAANTPANTYTVVVRATAAGNDNYNSGTKDSTVTVTIGKADPTATPPTGLTATYGQTLSNVTLTNPNGNTPGTWTWNSPTQNVGNAGDNTFQATFTPSDTTNYNIKTDVSVSVTVNKATVDTPVISSKTYNGSLQSADVAASELYNVTINAGGTDVGSYDVVLRLTDSENYKWSDSNSAEKTLTFSITQASGLTVSLADATHTYNGSAFANGNTPTTNAVSGITTFTYSFEENGTYVSNLSSLTKTEAGTYTIYVKATNPNYSNTATTTAMLTIDRKSVTITAGSDTKSYDGTALTAGGFTASDLETGDTHTFTVALTENSTITNAGTQPNVIATVDGVVVAAGTETVVGNYTVTTGNGTLTINKRQVTLTSATDGKVYDGTPLTNSTVTVSGDGWATGEGATYNVTGSQTLPGNSANAFTYTLNSGTSADNYEITKVEGTLTINNRSAKYEITVTANSDTVTYDGAEHTVSGFAANSLNFDGVTYTVSGLSASATGTDAGTYTATFSGTATVKDLLGNDLTAQFIVNKVNGSLTISPRSVTLTSATAEKQYDGSVLTDGTVSVTGDGWATGEGATYNVTGAQKLVGSSANSFTYTLDNDTKAGNYNITKAEGTLTVTSRTAKYQISPQANSGEHKYDGQSHTVSGFVTDSFTVEGNTYAISGLTASGSGIDAGTYTVNVSGTAVVKDSDGNIVTDQFSVTPLAGTLTIQKRQVTLTSATASKEYDGTALTNSAVTVSSDGFAEGEGATYTVTGTRTLAGTADNTFTYTLNANTTADNYTVTTNYGMLTVNNRNTKYKVTLTADSGEFLYDGTEKTVTGWTIGGVAGGSFTAENNLAYTVSGMTAILTKTDAGTYAVNVTGTPTVKDSGDNDVTAQFAVSVAPGTLKINKRSVVLTSATDSKAYDGTALANDTVTVGGNGWADGEGASYTVTGSQTLPGSSANAFIYTLNGGTKAENYTITKTEGTLTVTDRNEDEPDKKYEITITANSGEFLYDGTAHAVSGFTAPLTYTFNGVTYTVSGLNAELSKTDAGTYTVAVTGTAVVKDSNDNDLTAQFIVNTAPGTLTINKRAVTLTSATVSREYNGTALTDSTVTVTGDGWAAGEGASYTVTGSQTLVGSSANSFTYTLNSNTKAGNYTITTLPGTLTVTNRDAKYAITPVAKSETVLYDGALHTVTELVSYDWVYHIGDDVEVTYIISGLTVSGSGTDAGSYAVNVTGTAVIRDSDGNDVSDQFNVTPQAGTLTINRRSVTMTSATDEKEYDGTPLTNHNVAVTGDGWADGEGAAYAFTGTRTLVGEADNAFTYNLNDGTKADNYTITTAFGTLRVTDRAEGYALTVRANSGTYTYDGTEKHVSGFETLEFIIGGQTYTVTGLTAEAAATGAGTYPVTVTGTAKVIDGGGNDVTTQFTVNTADGTLTIEKADLSLAVSLEGWTDGSPAKEPVVTGNVGNGAVTFEYKAKDTADDAYSAAVPTTAGDYTVRAIVAATDNYNGGTATADFRINSAYVPYIPGDSTPTTPETITVPISGEEVSVNVITEVKGGAAIIMETDIDKVLEAEEVGTVSIDVSSLKETVKEVVIPGAMVDKIADAVADEESTASGLEVKLPTGTVSLDTEAVAAVAEQTDGRDLTLHLDDIKVTELSNQQQDAVKELEIEIVLDVYMTSNGQRISDFQGGSATVRIPYALKDGQTAAGIVVWYVADDGTRTQIPASYDGENVVFTVPHFSNYVVTYEEPEPEPTLCPRDETCPMAAFTDLDPTAWYHDGIHFCIENGMMNGVGNGKFDPTGTTSRAMIVTILYRLEGEPDVTGENPFSDVADGQWYTKAVIWAAENKIVEGYEDGTFRPTANITREQLATILYRYARSKGQGFTGMWYFLLDYPDASEISSWADEAMHWCVMNGIINGKDGKLVPKGDASRAESATMLMRYCTLG